MTLQEMRDDLPQACAVGVKRNAKGYRQSWTGYKLHLDALDGGIPVRCLLPSASVHDSQVAIPLATLTEKRVNGRLKDEFGGRQVRVRGPSKVYCHLLFGILALTVDQLMRLTL